MKVHWARKPTLIHLTLVDPYWAWKSFLLWNPNKLYSQIYSWYMSYLRELIEHGIMLVSCNKDVLRLSVGGSIELLIHSFFIHSTYSSDSHLSHSTPFTKKVGDSRLKYNEKFKIKYNGDSKSSEIKVIKFKEFITNFKSIVFKHN